MPQTKQDLMTLLVKRRIAEKGCDDGCSEGHFHYYGLGHFQDGVFECDHVSPTSIAAGNLDAEVMLVGQDWDSEDTCRRVQPQATVNLGYDPAWPTNRNADALLRVAFSRDRRDVFWTNLFPFIKGGAPSANIPRLQLERCARDFALPQIDIVQPRLVVCFGLATYNALAAVIGAPQQTSVANALAAPVRYAHTTSPAVSMIWCQSHPGSFGKIHRERVGGKGQVDRDWAVMAAEMRG